MDKIIAYSGCFVCGHANDAGLHLKFYSDGDDAVTELISTDQFEGYRGIFHGGIVSTVLDEVMIKSILAKGIYAVTAELTVRFKHPVRTGERVSFRGRIIQTKGRLYTTSGEALGEDGRTVAAASGLYLEARPELKQDLIRSIDT